MELPRRRSALRTGPGDLLGLACDDFPMTLPLRAILVGEFWAGATARGLVAGLRSAGWEVGEINTNYFFPSSTSLMGRIEGRLRRASRRQKLQDAVLNAAKGTGVDVFLTVKGVEVESATLRALRKLNVMTANYYPDCHFYDVTRVELALYDLVVTTKLFQLETLEHMMPSGGVGFVAHGYSPEVHRKLGGPATKDVDVLYVGNAEPEKAKLMIALASALPDMAIRVVGDGWKKYAAGTPLAAAVAGHQSIGDFYSDEISRAKITLGFHGGRDPRTGFADLVSTRTFEIPACGGFMLHIDNDEVRTLYDVPSEIDTFTDVADLVAKVRYWLEHPIERAAVAARGYSRAVPAYSYTERGRELAALIERRLGRTHL